MKSRICALAGIAATVIVLGCMGSGGQISSTTTGSTTTGSTTTGSTTTTASTTATNGTTATGTTTGGGGGTVNVSMTEDLHFSPQIATAHAGDTIVWTNVSSDMPHTVTSDTGQTGLDSSTQYPGGISPGQTFSWNVPGNASVGTNFFYHCSFHGGAGNGTSMGTGMAGEITID